MWRLPDMRRRLIAHCIDERHPYRERFERHRPLLEEVLSSEFPEAALDYARPFHMLLAQTHRRVHRNQMLSVHHQNRNMIKPGDCPSFFNF